ncbi:MAG TPA: HD domain-containing protein, partial [Ktedonobacteraceae bacterium]
HLALHLAEQEQADGFVVGTAALLHDVGRTTHGPTRSHAARSVKLAHQLLDSYDLPHERRQAILHAIQAHGYRHGIEPETLEARVLYDADRLDSLGASGIMRWGMTMKRGHWPEIRTYHPDDPFALWQKHKGGEEEDQLGEDFQHGGVVEMFPHSEEQHSA